MRLLLLTTFFFTIGLLSLLGQNEYLKFTDILNKKNLTNASANCITQDETGFIWIGTSNGLNRFDGYRVKQYMHKLNDSTSIPHDEIFDLHIDEQNRLWVLTKLGICRYNKYLDNFETIADVNNHAGLPDLNYTKIKTGINRKIYINSNECLFTYNSREKYFEEVLNIPQGNISNFTFSVDSGIWISAYNRGGVYRYSKNNELIKHYTEGTAPFGLSNTEVTDISFRNNEIWLSTLGGGINCIDITTGKTKHIPIPHDYAQYATKIYIDNTDKVWSIDYTGLKEYDATENILHGYYYNKKNKFTIKPGINAIFQDRQGIYWTLHTHHGVGQSVPLRGFRFFNQESAVWKTSNSNISAIAEDPEGNLWLGNPNDGLDIFYWSQHSVKTFLHDRNNPYSIGEGSVNAILKDSRGTMWIGTYKGGLQYFDPKTERFITFSHSPENNNTLSSNSITDIKEDASGNLWVATNGKGIDVFHPDSGVVKHYNTENSGLSNDYVFDLLIDKHDNVWAAGAWALSLMKADSLHFRPFYNIRNDSTSISNDVITCLHQDDKNRIWVGTEKGLNLYNDNTDDFERINLGKTERSICAVLSDAENNLWISTISGIIMYNTEENTFKTFDDDDALSSYEYNKCAAYNNKRNTLFFGGTEGVDLISPDHLHLNADTPRVAIIDFKLFYKSFTDYSPTGTLQKNIIYTNRIDLQHDENVIGFQFNAFNFHQPERNRYAYKMEGFDKDWVYSGSDRQVTYTNLNPGTYTFRVKAANNDGIWNEKGAAVELHIIPPWWTTGWFKALMAFIVIWILFSIYKIRVFSLKRQRKKLTETVNDKTKELNAKNRLLMRQSDDLADANAILEERQQHIEEQSEELKAEAENREKLIQELQKTNLTKDKMFSIISHDLRGPFGNIMGFSEILSESYEQFKTEKVKDILDTIYTSTGKVYNLLENLLKWAKSQTGNIAYAPKNHKLSSIFEDIDSITESTLQKKEISYTKTIDDNQQVYIDIDMIKTVVRNLLSNAVKFTDEGGTVQIKGQLLKEYYQIKIIDTGMGMPEEIIKKLFLIDNDKVRNGTNGEKGSGLGLVLCREFVYRNHGQLSVDSTIDKGSTFSITLPVGKKQNIE